MKVTVLNPNKVIYDGNAYEVILPAETGELSVLDFHQTFLCRLMRGDIKIIASLLEKEGKGLSGKWILIKKGIARMLRNELVIVAELQ